MKRKSSIRKHQNTRNRAKMLILIKVLITMNLLLEMGNFENWKTVKQNLNGTGKKVNGFNILLDSTSFLVQGQKHN